MARKPGSTVLMVIAEDDQDSARSIMERLAEIGRADLEILGDDYTMVMTSYPKEGTISIHCEKKYWLRDAG